MLESRELALEVAHFLAESFKDLRHQGHIDLHFKGSFDKANRSSAASYRGPGLELGLEWLREVKEKTGLKVITDFHYPEQAALLAPVVDVLQVPAFLCRQTDMIVAGAKAAAEHGRVLKVKKGQFLAPQDVGNILEKIKGILPLEQLYITERGSSFGYQQLVVDMAGLAIMRSLGAKVIFDATHSAQKPGALGATTGGDRRLIPTLARAAAAAGVEGFFMEVHPNPAAALSDASTQIPLKDAPLLVRQLVELMQWRAAQAISSWELNHE